MAIERELETFRNVLPRLLKEPDKLGQFVLIHGDSVDSFWPTVDEALAAGDERFAPDVFLIKQVVEHERPFFFTRRVKPCR